MKKLTITLDLFTIACLALAVILAFIGLVSWWVVLLIFLSTCHYKIVIGDK